MTATVVPAVRLRCTSARCPATEVVLLDDAELGLGDASEAELISAARDMRARVVSGDGWLFEDGRDYCPEHTPEDW